MSQPILKLQTLVKIAGDSRELFRRDYPWHLFFCLLLVGGPVDEQREESCSGEWRCKFDCRSHISPQRCLELIQKLLIVSLMNARGCLQIFNLLNRSLGIGRHWITVWCYNRTNPNIPCFHLQSDFCLNIT